MSKLEELELEILRKAIDIAEKKQQKKANGPEVQEIIQVVEEFLKNKKLICYGGTAINNILPEEDKFYNKDLEIPDYDFFSPNALNDAKELADIYARDFEDVEAKAGVHYGTYKVFVNHIPVADITHMNIDLFNAIKKDSISVGGILYSPPDYLRMAMYLELSRPGGDVSRWEKVLKRLLLLNKNYQLRGSDCLNVDFQRGFQLKNKDKEAKIFKIVRDSLIDQGCVFFGALAHSIYASYMPKKERRIIQRNPDFDVLAVDPEYTATVVKERLEYNGFNNIIITKKPGIGEIVAPHYEISMKGEEIICFIYEPLACHSYNVVKVENKKVKVATIDTMLSFYLAFLYSNRDYYDPQRILCMSEFLFKVQQRNRLQQKGVLRRFSINCYGNQTTLESMRDEKAGKFKILKDKKNTKEYDEWFLRYIPSENKTKPTKTIKTKTKKEKQTKKVKMSSKESKKNKSVFSNIFKLQSENNKDKKEKKKKKEKKTVKRKNNETFKIPLY